MTSPLAKWAAAVFLAVASPVAAAQTDPDDTPDLVGTWQCVSDGVAAYHGFQPRGEWRHRMVITEQLGLVFRGHIEFELDRQVHSDAHIGIEGHAVVSDEGGKVRIREDFVGTIGWDDTYTMVDKGDLGMRVGKIDDADTLRQVFSRPGEAPIASRETCTRRQ